MCCDREIRTRLAAISVKARVGLGFFVNYKNQQTGLMETVNAKNLPAEQLFARRWLRENFGANGISSIPIEQREAALRALESVDWTAYIQGPEPVTTPSFEQTTSVDVSRAPFLAEQLGLTRESKS